MVVSLVAAVAPRYNEPAMKMTLRHLTTRRLPFAALAAVRLLMRHTRRSHATPQRRAPLALLGLALTTVLALLSSGCAVHSGTDVVAFVQGGALWTVNPDGTGAQAIATGNVVGFAWSPDHHQLVLRYGGKAVPPPSENVSAPDAPSLLGVIGVDGGAVVTISPDSPGLARSDAWWDVDGNRLLYREGFPVAPGQEPASVVYQLSQADQPVGIARKTLLDAATMPAMAPDGSQVAVIDPEGNVRLGAPEQTGRAIASDALLTLPGGSRPARLLWQPDHQALLFAQGDSASGVRFVLTDLQGHTRTLGTAAAVLDYAFSPDGSQLLVQTPAGFEVWRVGNSAAMLFSWPESDPTALAWWSPDGRYVLVRDQTGLRLADVKGRSMRQLLVSGTGEAGGTANASPPSWHPLAGSPWSTDGQRIVFAEPGTGTWRGHALPTDRSGRGGIYAASVSAASGAPLLIDAGQGTWPSWSYLDPSASFLAPS